MAFGEVYRAIIGSQQDSCEDSCEVAKLLFSSDAPRTAPTSSAALVRHVVRWYLEVYLGRTTESNNIIFHKPIEAASHSNIGTRVGQRHYNFDAYKKQWLPFNNSLSCSIAKIVQLGAFYMHEDKFTLVKWYHQRCVVAPECLRSPFDLCGIEDVREEDLPGVLKWLGYDIASAGKDRSWTAWKKLSMSSQIAIWLSLFMRSSCVLIKRRNGCCQE